MAGEAQDPRPERVVLRPRRVRIVCWLLAPAVLGAFVLLANGLAGPTGSGTGVFQPSDRWAMIGLGVLAAGAILAFTRPKVIADRTGVKVRNVLGAYELPWEVVRSIRFDRGNAWASLELQDDDTVAVMALQAADKEYALAGVRALRRLLAARTAPSPGAGDTGGTGDTPTGRGQEAGSGPDLIA